MFAHVRACVNLCSAYDELILFRAKQSLPGRRAHSPVAPHLSRRGTVAPRTTFASCNSDHREVYPPKLLCRRASPPQQRRQHRTPALALTGQCHRAAAASVTSALSKLPSAHPLRVWCRLTLSVQTEGEGAARLRTPAARERRAPQADRFGCSQAHRRRSDAHSRANRRVRPFTSLTCSWRCVFAPWRCPC